MWHPPYLASLIFTFPEIRTSLASREDKSFGAANHSRTLKLGTVVLYEFLLKHFKRDTLSPC